MKKFYSKDEVNMANSFNVIDLLRYAGYILVKESGHYYLKEHDSLKISETDGWYWFSKGIGNVSNINLFMELENLSFVEATSRILSIMNAPSEMAPLEEARYVSKKSNPDGIYIMPEKNEYTNRIEKYLIEKRKLDVGLVKWLIKTGKIYESKGNHNVVFVGKDYDGNVVSSFERGTAEKKFAGDTLCSNKDYRLRITNSKSRTVNVFEAEIDMLSYICIKKNMAANYISLGGLSMRALNRFLLESKNDIKIINLCLDNDHWADLAAERFKKAFNTDYIVTRELPKLKDFNEDLIYLKTHRGGQ